MARIKPLDIEELPAEVQETADRYKKNWGYIPNSFRTMSRKPKIAKAYGEMQKALQQSLTIPKDLRTMMFHIQSANTGCKYCQAHSISTLSHSEDFDKSKLGVLWEFETNPIFSDAERAALRFALAASSTPNTVSDVEFDELSKYYSDEQIVEMGAAMAVGAFLNMWNDTMGTQLEDQSREVAEEILSPRGWDVGKHA